MVDVLAPGPDGSPVQKQIPNPLYSYSFDLDYVNNNRWFNSPVGPSSLVVPVLLRLGNNN